jgi:integrase
VKIHLRYVQLFVVRKNGKTYTYGYLRRPGFDRVRLPGLAGSTEFLAGYYAAMNGGDATLVVSVVKEAQQSIKAAVTRYLDEALGKRVKSQSTQQRQRSTLNTFVKLYGDNAVASIDATFIKRQVADAKTKIVGRTWLITVREFCKWAVEEKYLTADPTDGIVVILDKSDGHATVTEPQIAQFKRRWELGTRERLMFTLLLCSGQRCSDVRLLGPSSIEKGGKTFKTIEQIKTGAKVTIPVLPELAEAIAACKVVGPYFFLSLDNKPIDQRDLNKWFRKACREAGLPDSVVPHGLRKACCRRLAQAGCSVKQIAAVSGHQTLKEIERYTRDFDNEQGARDAFAKLTASGVSS